MIRNYIVLILYFVRISVLLHMISRVDLTETIKYNLGFKDKTLHHFHYCGASDPYRRTLYAMTA